ncbi:MAG: uroporphyrinogen-III C-methyltransferase [Gammaproteobacteria bacterium]|nr:uroporphyrinogen-III C-methyltransferase [Gammaproteobacteria bacterium]
MQQLPVFLTVRNKTCLVVGGGAIAARKVGLLLKADAGVRVIAPQLGAKLTGLHKEQKFEYLAREFQDNDVIGATLVIAATDDRAVNKKVSEAAQAQSIPVNVVDTPELCTFTFGSIVERDPVTIAISSAGQSPVLARALKAKLESVVPAAFGRLAALAGRYRQRAKSILTDEKTRRRFWESIIQGPVSELVFAGREEAAEEMLQDNLKRGNTEKNVRGQVYLVGAGPGDPDLLTFRALRILQKADVIFYDRLITEEILNLARRDAERFYVGKQRAHHCVPQSDINHLLVENARKGKTVIRLKGGDPFVFGRGGEEAIALAEAGIEFQVIPGITAASGCTTYAGIPLTHRDYAQSCRFITGHSRDGELNLNWQNLAVKDETLVFYMAVDNLPIICSKLIEHGLPADFPVAVIEQGTTHKQRVVTATLEKLPQLANTEEIKSPGIVVVGKVVELQKKLGWFNKK